MLRRLWVIGDSWTDPAFGGWGWEVGWPTLVARRLGLSLTDSGKSGAGYVNTQGEGWNYPLEVSRAAGAGADAVIVWGSINDAAYPTATIAAAVTTTLNALRALSPGAVIIVYGPQYWDTQPAVGMIGDVAAVRGAAQAAGALFVDVLWWMQGRPELIDVTGHPNQAGHQFIADRVWLDLFWAMGPTRQPEPPVVYTWMSPLAAAATTTPLERP